MKLIKQPSTKKAPPTHILPADTPMKMGFLFSYKDLMKDLGFKLLFCKTQFYWKIYCDAQNAVFGVFHVLTWCTGRTIYQYPFLLNQFTHYEHYKRVPNQFSALTRKHIHNKKRQFQILLHNAAEMQMFHIILNSHNTESFIKLSELTSLQWQHGACLSVNSNLRPFSPSCKWCKCTSVWASLAF